MACILSSINAMNHSLQVQSGPRRLLTTMQALLLLAVLALLSPPPAQAITTSTTYTLPADLTSSPFNCTMVTATSYKCGSISLDKDALLVLTSDVTISVTGSFSSAKNLATSNQGHTLQLTTSGDVSMQKDTDIDMSITAKGNISFAKNAQIDGNLTTDGNLTLAKDATINGDVTVGGNLVGAKNDVINGNCNISGTSNITCNSSADLHHLLATFAGTTSTCANTTVTITACDSANSNGTCTPYTGGISGTLTADADDDAGTMLVSVAFSIDSGKSSTTVSLPAITTAQTAGLNFSDVSKTTSSLRTCWNGSASDCTLTVNACGADHVRLSHAGNGVTCVPSTVTVYACSDADVNGSCTANTTGITGNVVATGTNGSQVASAAFTIPSGSSSVAVSIPVATAQTVTLSTSGLSPTPSGNPQTTCWNGSSASCSYTYADSGFIFDVGDHQAGNLQNVTMQAVKKADNSTACTPTLPNNPYTLNFSCSYTDPATGTQSVTVVNAASQSTPKPQVALACGSGASPLSLQFTNSKAFISVSYPDAGRVTLSASYTAGNGVVIAGNDTFVAAPAKFVIGATTSPLQADVAFNATVTAVNSSGATMPNFGRESSAYRAQLTFSKCGGTTTGTFGGSLSSGGVVNMPAFSSGVSTATGLKYSEVGTLDGIASMTDSGYTAATGYLTYATAPTGKTNTASTGCSGSFGTFQPARFETTLLPIGSPPKFAYSGIPFTVRVTAKNGSGNTVQNYTGTFAKDVTLSAVTASGNAVASTAGTMSDNTVNANNFPAPVNGTGAGYYDASPAFTFPTVTGGVNGTKLAPQKIYIRATDANTIPVTSALTGTNPSPYEASIEVRYGRLRLFNAYGASLSSVKMPLQAEYWNGSVWVVNGDDSTTSIPSTAFGFPASGNTATVKVQSGPVKLTSGKGTVTLTNTNNNGTKGYADIAVNLGSTNGAVNSCLGTDASGTTAANLLGLRSYQGSKCSTTDYTYDPSARAYFGTQSQETKGIVHVREVFN